jgi:hypothetical protein
MAKRTLSLCSKYIIKNCRAITVSDVHCNFAIMRPEPNRLLPTPKRLSIRFLSPSFCFKMDFSILILFLLGLPSFEPDSRMPFSWQKLNLGSLRDTKYRIGADFSTYLWYNKCIEKRQIVEKSMHLWSDILMYKDELQLKFDDFVFP